MHPLRRTSRTFLVCAAVLVLATACREIPPSALPEGPGAADRPDLRIAFVGSYDGATGGPATRAFEGARLALDEANELQVAPVDLLIVSVNTQADPGVTTEAVAEKIVADPEVVAVIGWPSTPEASVLAERLEAAGIAYLDVAPTYVAEAPARTGVARRRLVASDGLQAEAIARQVSRVAGGGQGPTACIGGDDEDLRGFTLQGQIAKALTARGEESVSVPPVTPGESTYPGFVDAIRAARCRVVVWTGGGTDAATIRLALDEAGLQGVNMVGADVMRNDAFLTLTGDAGTGARTACSCALVPDTASVELQRFIQAYQSTYGGAPGAYSMEGWDAANIVAAAVADGATTRERLADVIGGLASYDGLATDYRFDGAGVVRDGLVTTAEARAGRWAPAD